MTGVLVLAGVLALWNNAANLVPAFQRWYVPVNLTFAGVLLGVARLAGLSWEALGFAAPGSGVAWGAGVAAVIAVGLALAVAWPRTRRLLHDQRVAGLSDGELAATALVRIPLGTVVLEEIAFRGVLFGAWMQHQSTVAALTGSSVVFGVWHVAPSLAMLRANYPHCALHRRVAAVAAAVVLTGVGGAVLGGLRVTSGSLLAPALVHTAGNSLGAVASWTAHRRS